MPFDDALLEHLAERYGTPLYVYDLDAIGEQVATLRRALPEAQLFYAVKANPAGAVLRHLAALGVGAEVITLGELERALRAGIPADKLLLGGPRQDAPLIARAAQVGVQYVSLDSRSQAARWQGQSAHARFLLRLNPALDPRTHAHMATGAAASKFGMPLAEALDVAEGLQGAGRLDGFHVHAGSQISELEVYDEIFDLLAPLYERYAHARTLDLGGGFAVPGFPLDAFAERVRAFVARYELALVLEPGRYLVATAGVLLTRVLHLKEGPIKHVIADAGMSELIRPALYGARHPIRVVGRAGGESESETVDVDGPLCENADRLGQGVALPKLAGGELLAVEHAGAYGFTMASNYASSLRPAEVVVQGPEARLVRRRERVDDLWRDELA